MQNPNRINKNPNQNGKMFRSPSAPITEDGESNLSATKHESIANEDAADAKNDKLYNLYVKAISWPSEGRGLLHVLSPLLFCKDFKVRAAVGTYLISRDEQQLWMHRSEADLESGQEVVATLEVTPTGLILESVPHGIDKAKTEIWEEIGKGSDGRIISPGDILRFGSYKVKVVDIVLTDEAVRARVDVSAELKPFSAISLESDTVSDAASSISEALTNGGPVCRICFESSEGAENSLLAPCACSGSLRYIHVACLRRWLNGQLQVKQFDNGGGSYLIRTILCEICKSPYSKSVYQSILIRRPTVPHIFFMDFVVPNIPQSPSGNSSPPTSKIHIIPITGDKPIRIGRSKENEVVLSDISVSRIHAMLTLTEDHEVKFIDLNSKFGSLIQLPSRIIHPVSSYGSALRVQIGSSLIEVTATTPSRIERMLPDRFLQEKGIVKIVKSKSPNERILEADRLRRSRSQFNGTPASPAATLNNSFLRSPGAMRDEEVEGAEMPDEALPPALQVQLRQSS